MRTMIIWKEYLPGNRTHLISCAKGIVVPFLLFVCWINICLAGELSTRNLFSAYATTFGADALPEAELGVLWQPDIGWRHSLAAELSIGTELSAQINLQYTWDDEPKLLQMKGEAYRYVLQFNTPQSELRMGLQRLNFGAAHILRPLQWFDNLKARDTLEQTSGVKAILARHYFSNNANIWLWSIWGEEDIVGNELLPSEQDQLQWGGRMQIPNPLGETALSFHTRKLCSSQLDREYRLGFDHRMDSFIGAWVEVSGSRYEAWADDPYYSGSVSLGADYTFAVGNGLALTLENQALSNVGAKPGTLHNELSQTALMLSYPLGLLDEIIAINTWNWQAQEGIASIIWRRTYNYFSCEMATGVDSGMAANISRCPYISFRINYNV